MARRSGGARPFPLAPSQPHRLCWGCERYCASHNMLCGNGSVRTPHPMELFGEDWWREECSTPPAAAASTPNQES